MPAKYIPQNEGSACISDIVIPKGGADDGRAAEAAVNRLGVPIVTSASGSKRTFT